VEDNFIEKNKKLTALTNRDYLENTGAGTLLEKVLKIFKSIFESFQDVFQKDCSTALTKYSRAILRTFLEIPQVSKMFPKRMVSQY
jgi:hypothetical protein